MVGPERNITGWIVSQVLAAVRRRGMPLSSSSLSLHGRRCLGGDWDSRTTQRQAEDCPADGYLTCNRASVPSFHQIKSGAGSVTSNQ